VYVPGMSPRILENRMKTNSVAMNGKNRIPFSPIVSRIMPLINSTSNSARLCNRVGTSRRPPPALMSNSAARAMMTHIMITALLSEISRPNRWNAP